MGEKRGERSKETSCGMVLEERLIWMKTWEEAVFNWISEMKAGNLRFIIKVSNKILPHLEAWSHIKAWSEKITFE